jgi:hypothetical protein
MTTTFETRVRVVPWRLLRELQLTERLSDKMTRKERMEVIVELEQLTKEDYENTQVGK